MISSWSLWKLIEGSLAGMVCSILHDGRTMVYTTFPVVIADVSLDRERQQGHYEQSNTSKAYTMGKHMKDNLIHTYARAHLPIPLDKTVCLGSLHRLDDEQTP